MGDEGRGRIRGQEGVERLWGGKKGKGWTRGKGGKSVVVPAVSFVSKQTPASSPSSPSQRNLH